jgi:hypothetical protein
MPHRKFVQIGEAAKLPTVGEFFMAMARRQGEDIQRLKAEAAARTGLKPQHPPAIDGVSGRQKAARKKPSPDAWRLHARKKH